MQSALIYLAKASTAYRRYVYYTKDCMYSYPPAPLPSREQRWAWTVSLAGRPLAKGLACLVQSACWAFGERPNLLAVLLLGLVPNT